MPKWQFLSRQPKRKIKMRKRRNDYKSIDPDPKLERQPGERIRITGRIFIDYSVFKKTPEEKTLLKLGKSKAKEKKRSRPGREQRARLKLKSNP